jgi:hypothetical protein
VGTLADMSRHSTVEPLQAWGSRGRGFESRRPDLAKGKLSWPFLLTVMNVLIVS